MTATHARHCARYWKVIVNKTNEQKQIAALMVLTF